MFSKYGLVAQLVEQWTLNPMVEGSSPSGPTIHIIGKLNMAKKGARENIKLESTAKTGYFYVTQKNKKQTKDKINIKKYDPKVRKHVEFKEVKLK